MKGERKTVSFKRRGNIMGTEGLKGEQSDCCRRQQPAGSWGNTATNREGKTGLK